MGLKVPEGKCVTSLLLINFKGRLGRVNGVVVRGGVERVSRGRGFGTEYGRTTGEYRHASGDGTREPFGREER